MEQLTQNQKVGRTLPLQHQIDHPPPQYFEQKHGHLIDQVRPNNFE